jgi:hypothetical protein
MMKNIVDRNLAEPIRFCHIAPTAYLKDYVHFNGAHLILAHLVEEDEAYRDFYANLNDGKVKIMDNSAFEMFKQGRPMYESDKLIEMGTACGADVVVLSDYPKEDWNKTREAAERMIPELKAAGFGTFYVPQTELGDVLGLLKSFEWAIANPDIDLIGVSILAAPIALGVDESAHGEGERSDAYKLQRFMSRWKIFQLLGEAGYLKDPRTFKRFHCLGMTDGPNEIELLNESGFAPYIYSWDSSAAIWAGLNNVEFDHSPTGLMKGKFEKEVDFGYDQSEDFDFQDAMIRFNIDYINGLL